MDERELRELLPEYMLGTLEPNVRVDVERAMAQSPALRAEASTLAQALYALPETLEPEPLPDGTWERLRNAVRAERGGAANIDADEPVAGRSPGAPSRSGERPIAPRSARPRLGRSRPWGGTMIALVAAVALVIATGAWGLNASQQRARLANEQRIIAYWMRNPDLRILHLQSVNADTTAAPNAPEVRLGVICFLPDGRAMLLQPNEAPRGTRYVLYGDGPEGRVELGATRHRFLLFDGGALAGVELAVEGRGAETVGDLQF